MKKLEIMARRMTRPHLAFHSSEHLHHRSIGPSIQQHIYIIKTFLGIKGNIFFQFKMVTITSVAATTSARITIFPILIRLFLLTTMTVILSSTVVLSSFSSSSSSSSYVRGNNESGTIRKLYNSNGGRGLERCLEDKIFSERVEIGTKCVCKDKTNSDDDDDKGIVLVCSDQCAFCNDERSVCGIKSVEALYDTESGSKIGIGQVFEYLKFGPITDYLSEEHQLAAAEGVVLGIEELDCDEEDVDNTYILGRCSKCNVYFGGTKCNFCEVTECDGTGSGTFAPIMDCTNIQENAIFDFCLDIEMEEYSLFQAFRPDQFHKCLPMENLLVE